MDLKDHIRGIPDFPKPGILFYDISTLLRDADAWQVAMGRMAKAVRAYQPGPARRHRKPRLPDRRAARAETRLRVHHAA